jgi:hypothetical protein
MPNSTEAIDPFRKPTPYEVLKLKHGIRSETRDISRAWNELSRDAKRESDVKARAARMQELDWAKSQLQRPESRALLDFFALSNQVFADLCISMASRMAEEIVDTAPILGRFSTTAQFDDLLPASFDNVTSDFHLDNVPRFFMEPADAQESLCLTEIS